MDVGDEIMDGGYERAHSLLVRHGGAQELKNRIEKMLDFGGEGRQVLEELSRREINVDEAARKIMAVISAINVND